ncbi:hypothetical protein ABZ816_00050 [Actinosynnema sp. NPDC047251]|uniref:hypothetical protein n=1 Tax=Saccharothrix espanaensis TaxID=103731 RepID=UPI0002F2D031|nr:hypothetical protein [Saccharothrix espanaensis]
MLPAIARPVCEEASVADEVRRVENDPRLDGTTNLVDEGRRTGSRRSAGPPS